MQMMGAPVLHQALAKEEAAWNAVFAPILIAECFERGDRLFIGGERRNTDQYVYHRLRGQARDRCAAHMLHSNQRLSDRLPYRLGFLREQNGPLRVVVYDDDFIHVPTPAPVPTRPR